MEPRKHYFAKIPTIAIFIVMAMSGPLGVLLFILKGIDQKVQKEEQEAARARGDYRPDPEPAPMQNTNASDGQDVPTAEQKSAKQWHKNIATLCTIMGAVFLFFLTHTPNKRFPLNKRAALRYNRVERGLLFLSFCERNFVSWSRENIILQRSPPLLFLS